MPNTLKSTHISYILNHIRDPYCDLMYWVPWVAACFCSNMELIAPLPVPDSARAPDEVLARDGGSIRGVQGMTTKAKGTRVQKQTGKVKTKHKHKKITEGLAVGRGKQRDPKPDDDGEATHRQTEIMGYLK